jgi:pantoate--beta-alanine ligase
VREEDGLAKSSRNRRFSIAGRAAAFNVYLSLKIAQDAFMKGKSATEVKNEVNKHFTYLPMFNLEYLEIVDFETFDLIKSYDSERKTAICTANYLEAVRLIDNIVF